MNFINFTNDCIGILVVIKGCLRTYIVSDEGKEVTEHQADSVGDDVVDTYDQTQAELDKAAADYQKAAVQDWNAEWKKHYRPIDVHPELCIVPAWEKKASSASRDLFINPVPFINCYGSRRIHSC